MNISKSILLDLYRIMYKIRSFEERVSKLFAIGKIPGFIHLYLGQEAVAAGVCAHLKDGDYITSTHRGHGHCIARGLDVKRMMAELFGKRDGYCKGKGGSMHIADINAGILGANGIVGAGIPIAVGAAFSAKVNGSGQVAVSFFGEGATSTGYFHEALNLAALLKLPVLFVCETNQYAEFTPKEKHVPVETVAERAQAYGFDGKVINGNDVLEVYQESGKIIEQLRQGNGPFLLECVTDRWSGHYEGDPQRYRSVWEEQKREKEDPIQLFLNQLVTTYNVDSQEIKTINEQVIKEIEEAVDFAQNSPLPEPDELLEDVYA